jgi:hypothetical protein
MTATRKELSNILDLIKEEYPGTQVRIAVVGYRDHKDVGMEYSCLDFTSDAEKVKDFIKNQIPMGGDDIPEDIAGAFNLALKQSWKSTAKYAILITDAPCHGKEKYHYVYDSYPEGDPHGHDPEKQV